MRRAIIIIFLAMSLPALAAGTWTLLTSGTTQDLYGLHYSNGPVVCGKQQTALKSADGTTWAPKTTTITSLACYGVDFPTVTVGYMVGSFESYFYGRVWKTADGGESWGAATAPNIPSPPLHYNGFYGIYFIDQNLGWITGPCFKSGNLSEDYAVVYRTDDGSYSWTMKNSGLPSANFYGLHFVDSATGWIVGDSGRIYKTLNGGNNWTQQDGGAFPGGAFIGASFADSNNGLICGFGGSIVKTTNSGAVWTAKTSGTTQNLYNVQSLNRYISYAAGAGGTVIKSSDGGETWTTTTLGGGVPELHRIFFRDAFNGWVVGTGGSIYGFTVAPSITPTEGNPGWSGDVHITGDNFSPLYTASNVSFGTTDVVVTSVECVSATELLARVSIYPAATAGPRTVTITDPGGGSLASAFTVTTTPTGDSGPTISNPVIEGELNFELPAPTPGMGADIEDLGAASVGKALSNVDAKLYIDTNNSYIVNDPNTYEYFIDNYSYTPASSTRGKVQFVLANVKSIATGLPAGNLYSVIGTGVSFMPVISVQDTKGNRSFKEHHRVSFKSTLASTSISMLPSPTRVPPFVIQIITPNPADFGPAKLTVNNLVGSPISNIPITISNLRTNVIWSGLTDIGEHVANGMYVVNLVKNSVRARMKLVVAR